MNLLDTLVLFSYVYTTGVFLWLQDKYDKLRKNHLKHTEEVLNETRIHVGLPPVKIVD